MTTLVSRTTGTRSLRGGTPRSLLAAVPLHDFDGVAFAVTASSSIFLHFHVETLVFPAFKALRHELRNQAHRIPTSLSGSSLEPQPNTGTCHWVFRHGVTWRAHPTPGRTFCNGARSPFTHGPKIETHIPFVGASLKKEQDVDALLKHDSQGGRYPKSWQE
jgi:hypothetical protein